MTKTAAVRIGRVRSDLVVHMAVYGATCSSRRPVNVEVTERAATARLCKKCFTPARIARAQQANGFGKSFSATVANLLCAILDSRRTPAERAASAATFAQTQYAQDIAAANIPAPRRPVRTLDDIYRQFHPHHIPVEKPAQPALFPIAA